jgi:multidrug transporter EmrE-like cation transporter
MTIPSINTTAWLGVILIAGTSAAGDVLTAAAMRQLGGLDKLYSRLGLRSLLLALARNNKLWLGVLAMAGSFFSLLWSLSRLELSFVAPASNALTYLLNAVGAAFFLREHVTAQRWTAMLFVGAGVWLLAR